MEIQQTKELIWQTPDELRDLAKNRVLITNELLALCSSSFYKPIWLLELARGTKESNKRPAVTFLYVAARGMDTAEDPNPRKISREKRIELIDAQVRIYDQLAKRKPSDSIDDLIEDFSRMSRALKPAVMNDDEAILMDSLAEGGLLRDIRRYASPGATEAITKCCAKMAIGMKQFIRHKTIETFNHLNEYCGYVAGDVGVGLNDIVASDDGVQLSDMSAQKFGQALQTVNVIKGIAGDKKRGVSYVPLEIMDGLKNQEFFDMSSTRGRFARKKALDSLISHARESLRDSGSYLVAIPPELTGYQAFATAPFLAAVETLTAMENAGAEAVFRGERDAIKMKDGTFHNISNFAYSLALGDGKKTAEFLKLYRESQDKQDNDKYCFNPGRFEKWAKEL